MADALGITAGHQRRARRRADRGGVEAGQLASLGRHAIEVRRAIELGAERPDVRIAEVVDVDDDEIRTGFGGRDQRRGREG